MRVLFRPQAEAESFEAAQWYGGPETPLGMDFVAKVGEAVSLIQQSPYLHRAFEGPFRRVQLRRFPYALIYYVNETTEQAVVVSCFHLKREPGTWGK